MSHYPKHKLEVTWMDDSKTTVEVVSYDGFWVNEANELRVWFDDLSNMEIMEGVKSFNKISETYSHSKY
jgi:hypothetical protein